MADRRSDDGGGQISAAVGVTVLLLTLLLTVHVLLGAWSTTRAGTLAHEAARMVAESADTAAGVARAVDLVGRAEPEATLTVRILGSDPAVVEATVVMPGPTLVGTPAPFAEIERSARIPVEQTSGG